MHHLLLGMIGNTKRGTCVESFWNKSKAGWWFGTFVIFPYIGNVIIPTDELIFFRGVGLNHQPDHHLKSLTIINHHIYGIILPID